MADKEGGKEKESKEVVAQPLTPEARPWKFTQWFRKMQNEGGVEGAAADANFITAVAFDDSGSYLATGDKSGNVVILQNDPVKAAEKGESVHYGFFAEFLSHQMEFDFVRSLNIDERINEIKWGPRTNDSKFLLVTNDRQIKLWKVNERELLRFVPWNSMPTNSTAANQKSAKKPKKPTKKQMKKEQLKLRENLKVPKIVREPLSTVTTLKKQYFPESHTFNVTNLSVSSTKENFLSGDTLKINLWDLYRPESCFTVVDITPPDLRDLREIITTLDYHPTMQHVFAYGTNMGKINLCDMRQKAVQDTPARCYDSLRYRFGNQRADQNPQVADQNGIQPVGQPQDQQTMFDEVTSGVSCARFSHGGRFIISRDYMSIKIWDTNYEKRPIETIYVHEFLREKLYDLYQNDLLWDGFGLGISPRGDIVTGTYSNYFHVFDLGERKDVFIEASKSPEKISSLDLHIRKRKVVYQAPGQAPPVKKKTGGFKLRNLFSTGAKKKEVEEEQPSNGDNYPHRKEFTEADYQKKILNTVWHPDANAVAVAGQNNLFVYSK